MTSEGVLIRPATVDDVASYSRARAPSPSTNNSGFVLEGRRRRCFRRDDDYFDDWLMARLSGDQNAEL